MVKIRKRTSLTAKKSTADETKPFNNKLGHPQLCHYTILRHPLRDTGKGTFHKGAEDANITAVYNGVIAVEDCPTADDLFERIARDDHWFIKKHPGRYSVVAYVFGFSLTFMVMQDKTYHKGWLNYPKFLDGERARGVNAL